MPFGAGGQHPAVVDLHRPEAGRRRNDQRRHARALRRGTGRIAPWSDCARQPWRLSLQREVVAGERGRCDRAGHRREPTGRPDVRSLLRDSGRHDLRSRRRADPRGRGGTRRRGHRALQPRHARGADDVGGRADELLGGWAHPVRARAEARRDGSRRADPLVDAPGVRRRSVRRYSTGRASPRRTSPAQRRSSRSAIRRGRLSR